MSDFNGLTVVHMNDNLYMPISQISSEAGFSHTKLFVNHMREGTYWKYIPEMTPEHREMLGDRARWMGQVGEISYTLQRLRGDSTYAAEFSYWLNDIIVPKFLVGELKTDETHGLMHNLLQRVQVLEARLVRQIEINGELVNELRFWRDKAESNGTVIHVYGDPVVADLVNYGKQEDYA